MLYRSQCGKWRIPGAKARERKLGRREKGEREREGGRPMSMRFEERWGGWMGKD